MLESFACDYNQIECLPESFGSLSRLRKLEMQGNPMTALPTSFGNLSAECHVSANDMPSLPSPPREVFKEGPKAIVAWFDERGGYGAK